MAHAQPGAAEPKRKAGWLFLGLAGAVVIAIGIGLFALRGGDPDAARRAAILSGIGFALVLAWLALNRTLIRPLERIARDLELAAHAGPGATGADLPQQLADFRAGRPVGNIVLLRALSRPERRMLVDSFRGIERVRVRVAVELGGRTI